MHVPEEMKAKTREEDEWRDLVDIALATARTRRGGRR